MSSESIEANGGVSERGPGELTGPFLLAYLVGALLLGSLVAWGGVWDMLANTRLLDLLIRGGIVRLHDGGAGVIDGGPALTYWVSSQDPINGQLLLLAAGLFVLSWGIKAF